jgi:L-threonylcarbamoyladenylate synthase
VRLDGSDPDDVARAAQRLADGELLAFPTETVYGLGARADDAAAVAKIFAAKGRPAQHPLIVHVHDAGDVEHFAAAVNPVARRLIDAFWPGPLTLIVPRRASIAAAAAGGQSSIGLRCPSHPIALDLLARARALGVPGLAAPSANRFGRVSPTRAEHVVDEFGDPVWVLDGGACDVGIESSIVDCTREQPVWLRPGILTRDAVQGAAGVTVADADADAPRAPGTLASHYAPNAKVRLMSLPMLHTALQLLGQPAVKLAVYSRGNALGVTGAVRHVRMPAQPQQAAHELFSVLRALDAEGVQLIWVEEPPPDHDWDGVRDRLLRAAAS